MLVQPCAKPYLSCVEKVHTPNDTPALGDNVVATDHAHARKMSKLAASLLMPSDQWYGRTLHPHMHIGM